MPGDVIMLADHISAGLLAHFFSFIPVKISVLKEDGESCLKPNKMLKELKCIFYTWKRTMDLMWSNFVLEMQY